MARYTFDVPQSDNAIVVKTLADLPAPIDNRICLSDNEYLIDQPISSPYPICFPGAGKRSTIKSTNRATWTYTGGGACFEDPDAQGDIEIVGLTQFEAPNGDMFNISAVTGSWSFQSLAAARFRNCNSLGTLNMNGVAQFNTFFGTFADFDQGLVVNDPAFFELNTMFMFGNNQPGCTHVTVQGTGTVGSINIGGCTFSIGSNETVFNLNSNIEATVDSISLHNNQQEGGINGLAFASGSLDFDTPKLFSRSNSFFEDSKPGVLSYLDGNTTNTVIPSVNTPVRIEGPWSLLGGSQFTATSDGRWTYNGINNLATPIEMAFSSTIVGGGGQDSVTFYAALNGSIISASKAVAEHDTADPVRTILIWGQTLSTGDYIEAWVENNDDGSDILISDAVVRIN